ncbi:MAG: peroxiredoxin family protein [Bernardetiaceae bacterium]
MQKSFLLIYFFCLAGRLALFGQGTVLVSGQLAGPLGDSVYLHWQDHQIYFDPQVVRSPVVGGAFAFRFRLEESVLATLRIGDTTIPLFLQPWDSLHIGSQGGGLRTDLSFAGLGDRENDLLQTYRRLFLLAPEYRLYPKAYQEKSPADFAKELLRQEKKIQKWWREAQRNVSLSAAFSNYFEAHLRYRFANERLAYGQYHTLQDPDFYAPLLPLIQDRPEWLSLVYEYSRFLELYLDYRAEGDLEKAYQLSKEIFSGRVQAHVQAQQLAKAWTADAWKEMDALYSDFRKNSRFYIDVLHRRYQQLQGLRAGTMAPDFILPNTKDQPVSLHRYRGQHVLLTFWRTDCMACIPDMERISRIAQSMSDQLTVIAVALDEQPEQWKSYLQKRPLNGLHLRASGIFSAVARRYALEHLPAVFLIDPEGRMAPYPGRPAEGLHRHLQATLQE